MFETNSSSLHTISISGQRNLNEYCEIDGDINISLGQYGCSGDPCDDFYTKLSYALSLVLITEYPGFSFYEDDLIIDQSVLENLDGYNLLRTAINCHGNCDRIFIKRLDTHFYPYGYIDHQSYEDYSSFANFLDDWNIDAERFLFDDNVVIYIDNDN